MIKLSTTCRYATRILIYLAAREDERPAARREIALAEDITPAYIEQVLGSLKASGLIRSVRGAKGGFLLGKPAELISVADVVEATEGVIALVPCLAEGCNKASSCVARTVWKDVNEALKTTLAKTTIADMAKQSKSARKSTSGDFEI